ncbi:MULTISPECIES: cytochrome c [unclassified Meiothermus]|uniref:c-type cytochrome n=1 Tax=unclassified Meiothermus TaxID=370471 RepID=UPI000D7BC923|nr:MULTISPECIES: cytochrome c [unclassified Meiothermus]PZA06333.1 cytochrome c [Meiothermus sp. Pnk-1]RYM35268.1 cytochrome c [Meiothermus sp. PNK-Is4]
MKPFLLSFLLLGGLAAAQEFDGAKLYSACSGCHQATGQGIPGVFPPLAGHVPQILEAKGGREYLVRVMLYGLQGPIEVKGSKYAGGAMPAWSQLKDGEIAAILNYISTAWGNKFPEGQKPFTPEEVGAGRAQKLTAAQVLEARKALGLK